MKQIRLLWVGLLCMTVFSCYEDKGHYDYTTRQEIEIEGLEEKYTKVSLSDTLRIPVDPLLQEEYDCLWMLKGVNSFDFDTISRDLLLEWPVTKPQGEYRLILKLISTTDGYSRWFESKLNITSTFSDGWFVLKDQEDCTDIDFFPTDTTRMTDILKQSIGRSLPGEARCMSLLGAPGYIQHDGKIDWSANLFYAGSSKDLWMVQIGDMSLQRDLSQLFFSEIPQGEPLNVPVNPQMSMCLSTGQGIFFQKLGGATTGQMGDALDFGGKMEIAKSTFINKLATYFYDQKNQRFLAVNYNGTPIVFVEDGWKGAIPPVKVNQTGCSLLYMGMNKYESDDFYSVMENAEGRYVYTLLAPKLISGIPSEDQRNLGTYNPIQTVEKLSAGFKIYEASLFAIASKEPYIYYNDAGGNTVHFYDILAKVEVNDVFPAISQAGERITFMKALFHDPDPKNPVPEDTFDKFVIATEKDGHYKVYLYDLLAGKPAPGRKPIVLKGEGRVCSVHKVFPGWTKELSRCSVNF